MTATDAANNRTTTEVLEGTEPVERPLASPLDGRLDLARLGWFGVASAVVFLIALGLRFVQLDTYVMTPREGEWAYDAWSLYTGQPMPAGQELPLVSPLYLLLQAGTFFLFGVTDAIARSLPVIAGLGIVALTFAFRPILSRTAVIGMALLAAIAPTLVFASRTIDPAILIAFFALLAIASVLRAGQSAGGRSATTWAGIFGASVGAMLASGPEGVSATIAITVALAAGAMSDGHTGPVTGGIRAIGDSATAMMTALAGFVVISLLVFTRLLSNAGALEGFLATFSDWGRMMATQTSTTPTQFFFYATLLYEFLAVIFAVVALVTASRPDNEAARARTLHPTLFLVWFLTALVLHSLASGRQPDQAVLVTLPLVLLGGIGLGRLFDRIPWRSLVTTRDGLLLAVMFGLFFGIVGVVTLIARANDPSQAVNSPYLRALFVLVIVILPLGFLIARESSHPRYPRYAGWTALLVVAVLLGAYTVRSATQLAWERADTGTELVAQRVPTEGVRGFVDQTLRLSRDLSLAEVSNVDNTGSFGISIAVDPSVEWPYVWYFRDFPDLRVATPAGWGDADMVIAPTTEGMEDANYITQSRVWLNRTPTTYEDLSLGTVLSKVVSPDEWYDGFRYLFFRELELPPSDEQIGIGYTFRLSNQMDPSAGPFDLQTGQSLGPGAALGQLNAPTGIALSNDGQVIYVVDSGNQRIQRFERNGTFIGSWSAEDDQRIGLGWFDPAGQGASDVVIGPDDLIYVADTWNHRIMILDADGLLVRELGRSGELTDAGDIPDPTVSPGFFYGPRSVAITEDEIFVTDTGNERVQVFASDGTFLRAFGGHGAEPGKLLEPVGIAIGPDGNVYVADTGNLRISVFAQDGTPVTQIPVPGWEGQASQQNYLRFDANGVLYLTSPGSGTVQAFNGTDFVTIQGGEAGGAIVAPVGLAIGADNQMHVSETTTSQVTEFPIVLPEGFASGSGGAPVATPEPTLPGTPPAVG
ncbi:MAG: hypothetical protein H0V37_08515 [Chloroflexia bacterium]|nr:hypothetical protein [Chloroflexia bacterium]